MDLFFEKEEKFEDYKEEKINHFNVMNKIYKKQKLTEKDIKAFNDFLFLKQLSMDKNFIHFANMLNQKFIKKEHILKIIENYNFPFIKFIKKDKEDEDIKILQWYFRVNKETARNYLKRINKNKLEQIKELYKETH